MTKPNPEDYERANAEYCASHRITQTDLFALTKQDDALAGHLYRLAVAHKLIRLAGLTPAAATAHPAS